MIKAEKRELWFVLALVAVSLVLYRLMWFWPLILVLPAIVAYTVSSASTYVLIMAVVAELFAVSPPGVAALVVALPWGANWLAHRYARNMTVDLTLRFLSLVGGVVVAQVLVMLAPTMWSEAAFFAVIPWWIYPLTLWVTGLIFVTSVMAHYNRAW